MSNKVAPDELISNLKKLFEQRIEITRPKLLEVEDSANDVLDRLSIQDRALVSKYFYYRYFIWNLTLFLEVIKYPPEWWDNFQKGLESEDVK